MTHEGGRPPALSLEAVAAEEAVRALFKAQRAQQLYSANSAARVAALDVARATLQKAWDVADPLVFYVRRDSLLFNDEPVLVESAQAGDGLAWLLYREGIREIRLMRGFEQAELEMFLDILARARTATIDQDDLVTMLWLANMTFFTYRHVEVVLDAVGASEAGGAEEDEFATRFGGGGGLEAADAAEDGGATGPHGAGRGMGGGGSRRALPGSFDEEVQGFLHAAHPQIVRPPEDDQPLVLDPEDLAYLARQVAREASDEHRESAMLALLEIVEMDVDEPSRLEAVAALDDLLVEFLGTARYASAAALLTEVDAVLVAADLDATVFEAIGRLGDRVSAPGVLRPLLHLVADPRQTPAAEVLDRLLSEMRPEALPTLLTWLGGTGPSAVRARVEREALALAEQHPQELAAALSAEDPTALLGALWVATRKPSPQLAGAVCRVADHADPEVRLAASALLAGLDGLEVQAALVRQCADPDRAVRMVGYRAVATRRLLAARGFLEGLVAARAYGTFDLNERLALFDALGAVANEETVDTLDRVLNARGLLGPREPADVRACAARALGRARIPAARQALERAADARDPIVQRAVRQALDGAVAS
jgi:hypothetical protein